MAAERERERERDATTKLRTLRSSEKQKLETQQGDLLEPRRMTAWLVEARRGPINLVGVRRSIVRVKRDCITRVGSSHI